MTEISPVDRERPQPLSFAQERLWFLAQVSAEGKAHSVQIAQRLRGPLDQPALRRALNGIVSRHDILRTTFSGAEGTPTQQVHPTGRGEFQLLRFTLDPHAVLQDQLEYHTREEARMPFDLENGPLVRGRLLRLDDEEYALLISMHHIVSDGWSSAIFCRELTALYRGESLPALHMQYADYAVSQRRRFAEDGLRREAEYWTAHLARVPAFLELPTDKPRPTELDPTGATVDLVLEEDLVLGLKALSRRHGTTLYMTLLAAWAVLLSRLSGQETVLIGSPVANRNRIEVEGLIGVFVNTVPILLDLPPSMTGGELLRQTRARTLAALEHQDLPFEQMVELVRPPRSLAHNPIMQAMFAWQNAPRHTIDMAGLHLEPLPLAPQGNSRFDVTLFLRVSGETIVGGLQYATALFYEATIIRYRDHLRTLLEGLIADDTIPVDRLPILSVEQKDALLKKSTGPRVDADRGRCLHSLFQEQAALKPDAVAVVHEDVSLSYGELNRRSNRLAHHLIGLGIGPGVAVAICLERGIAMVTGLLAILKAGGIYVPLDPAYPMDRLRHMVDDSGARALLTEGHLLRIFDASCAVLAMEKSYDLCASQPESNPSSLLRSEDLAYIIYTSGSTGTPKGVMVSHASAFNLLAHCIAGSRFLQRTTPYRASLWTSFCFDVSIFELFVPLSTFGTVEIVPTLLRADPESLLGWFITRQTAFGYLPAFVLRYLRQHGFREAGRLSFREILVGVEPIIESDLFDLRAAVGDLRIINAYGPTEATVFCSEYTDVRDLERRTPIGRPLTNTQLYLLDRHQQFVPHGVRGEIYVGGAGVATGYRNLSEMTAAKFLRDPFREGSPRMYRTGDFARWLPEDQIEFLGRDDAQVKLRGFRVELGEIEAYLAERLDLAEVAVLLRQDAPGEQHLVAYYTSSSHEATPASLRGHLAARLPAHMVPAAYVRVDAMPRLPNGKLDANRLPAPDRSAFMAREHELPEGETEAALAGIWIELLRCEQVGRHDNFFDLGGHSLLGTRMVLRIRTLLGVQLPLRTIFEAQTIARLAETIVSLTQEERPPLPPLAPSAQDDTAPLSFNQQSRLLADGLARRRGIPVYPFHVRTALRLIGPLDVPVVQASLQHIVNRHEVLRTGFHERRNLLTSRYVFPVLDRIFSSKTVQRVVRRFVKRVSTAESKLVSQTIQPEASLTVPLIDLTELPVEGRDSAFDRLVAIEGDRLFDYEHPPLMRVYLVRMAESEHILFFVIHHLVCDGWSCSVLKREFLSLYEQLARGLPPHLPEMPIQFRDFARWQRRVLQGSALEHSLRYWQRQLTPYHAVTPLDLPCGVPRPYPPSLATARQSSEFVGDLYEIFCDAGRRRGVTMHTLLFALVNTLLHCETGMNRVGIMVVFANRIQPETEQMIGNCVNSHIVHIDFTQQSTFAEVLDQTHNLMIEAQAHQEIPMSLAWSALAEEIQFEVPKSPYASDFVQFMFSEIRGAEEGSDLIVREIALPAEHMQVALRFLGIHTPLRLGLEIQYAIDCFDGVGIRQMSDRLHALARVCLNGMHRPIAQLRAGLNT